VINTPGIHDFKEVNTPESLDFPVVNTPEVYKSILRDIGM
jgi:hypothetical protein